MQRHGYASRRVASLSLLQAITEIRRAHAGAGINLGDNKEHWREEDSHLSFSFSLSWPSDASGDNPRKRDDIPSMRLFNVAIERALLLLSPEINKKNIDIRARLISIFCTHV